MVQFPSVESLTPEDFEILVKMWLDSGSEGLSNFTSTHLEDIAGQDGDYTFDVTAQFSTFGGALHKVVVECKRHSNPIKRELVQVLNEKKRSVGANKAMLVSTAPFQSGALKYAEKNGIALVQIISGSAIYIRASAERSGPSLEHIEKTIREEPFVGLFWGRNPNGSLIFPQLLRHSMKHVVELFKHE